VIGGLVTSTILSLLVIPPVFTIMDDLERLIKRGWAAMTGWRNRGKRATVQPATTKAAE
jgi:hypothetical protein